MSNARDNVLTLIGFLNFVFCQWFFFRICEVTSDDKRLCYGKISPIIPLTGWWSDFIPKKYTLTITTNKKVIDFAKKIDKEK